MYKLLSLDVNGKLPILPMKVYLLHKMEMVDPVAGILHELGGRVAEHSLQGVVAVHATCYEKSTKLLGICAWVYIYKNIYVYYVYIYV